MEVDRSRFRPKHDSMNRFCGSPVPGGVLGEHKVSLRPCGAQCCLGVSDTNTLPILVVDCLCTVLLTSRGNSAQLVGTASLTG